MANAADEFLVWRATADAPDGLAIVGDLVVVATPEYLQAFRLSDGRLKWDAPMSDTSGPTPIVALDQTVVVFPPYEAAQAFSLDDGTPKEVPVGAVEPSNFEPWALPDHYEYNKGSLSFRGSVVWQGRQKPWVGRMAEFTVVNDAIDGVFIVDDSGGLRAGPIIFGPRDYDGSAVVVRDDTAVTVASDGTLMALRIPER